MPKPAQDPLVFTPRVARISLVVAVLSFATIVFLVIGVILTFVMGYAFGDPSGWYAMAIATVVLLLSAGFGVLAEISRTLREIRDRLPDRQL